ELATALATLLENDGLRKDFAAAAARHVEAFDVGRVATRFLEALPV
ncbi:MAG: hypothetical protein HYR86_11425, partial [Candidatus Rokubacteria bacterium]|nr:hypothetical protein [Candidatus Rokubacteria bacterium]